jgi:hypothetical protein
MQKNPSLKVPDHLKDLIGLSYGPWKKLIAAWEGLTDETKVLFLQHIKEMDGLYELREESHIWFFPL